MTGGKRSKQGDIANEDDPTFFEYFGDPFDFGIYAELGEINAPNPEHCFIPTISSLAIDTDDPFYNIKADGEDIYSTTPFDKLYCPMYDENTNQYHVEITPEVKNWIISELIPLKIILNDEKEWGEGEICAKQSIKLMPGYNATEPVIFRIKE